MTRLPPQSLTIETATYVDFIALSFWLGADAKAMAAYAFISG
jgi:hypothetical protein